VLPPIAPQVDIASDSVEQFTSHIASTPPKLSWSDKKI
jgi:hypothetical protein